MWSIVLSVMRTRWTADSTAAFRFPPFLQKQKQKKTLGSKDRQREREREREREGEREREREREREMVDRGAGGEAKEKGDLQ